MAENISNWPDGDDDSQVDRSELRYFVAGEENGTWSVYDRHTNLPGVLDDRLLVELTHETADEILDLMNQIEEDSKPRPAIE